MTINRAGELMNVDLGENARRGKTGNRNDFDEKLHWLILMHNRSGCKKLESLGWRGLTLYGTLRSARQTIIHEGFATWRLYFHPAPRTE